MFKIATWNVNSLRVRLPHLLEWLQIHQPDVMALQETKITDENFPTLELQAAGYQSLFAGQTAYNGVALLSRHPGREVITQLPGLADSQKRIVGATYGKLRVLNLYVPNGERVGCEKYAYKLNWLQHLNNYIKNHLFPHLIVLGDFNIAPEDRDVYNPPAWTGSILVSPEERLAFQHLLALGLHDTFRLFEPAPHHFSWWDYRAKAFQRNCGLRIDFILASTDLISQCTGCLIDTTPRRLERPSDHAPVLASFNWEEGIQS